MANDGLMFPVTELWFLPNFEGSSESKEKQRRLSRPSVDEAFSNDLRRRSDSISNVESTVDMSPFFSEAERKRLLQYFGIYLAEKSSSGYDIPRGASSRRTIILISTCKGKKPKERCQLYQDEDFLTMMGKWLHSSPDAEINSFIFCKDEASASRSGVSSSSFSSPDLTPTQLQLGSNSNGFFVSRDNPKRVSSLGDTNNVYSPDSFCSNSKSSAMDVVLNKRDPDSNSSTFSRNQPTDSESVLVFSDKSAGSFISNQHYDEMQERPLSQLHDLLIQEEKKRGLFFSPAVTALRMVNPNLQMTFAREAIRKMGHLSTAFTFNFIRKIASIGCVLPSEENLLNLVDSGWMHAFVERDSNQPRSANQTIFNRAWSENQSSSNSPTSEDQIILNKAWSENQSRSSSPTSKKPWSKDQTISNLPTFETKDKELTRLKSIYTRKDILESKIMDKLLRSRKVLLDRGRATIDPDLFHIDFKKWILSVVLQRMGKKMYEHLQFLKKNEPYVRDPADKQLLKLNAQLNKAIVGNKGFGSITMASAPDCIKALHNVHMKDMIRFNLASIFANMFKVKDSMAYTQFIESISMRSSINYNRRSVIRQRIDSELAKITQIKKDMPCSTRQRIFGDNSKLGIVCPYSSPEGCLAKRAGTLSEIKEVLDPHSMTISDVWLHTNPI